MLVGLILYVVIHFLCLRELGIVARGGFFLFLGFWFLVAVRPLFFLGEEFPVLFLICWGWFACVWCVILSYFLVLFGCGISDEFGRIRD